ncbi:MAG: hypothetical protein ACUVWV_01415 [Thermodesulfobacteriota bacterium]
MSTLAVNEKLKSLIQELEFKDVNELIKDSLVTEILYRISNYSDEIEAFEKKYGKGLKEFQKEYESNKEDFEKYDDLMAWEFAEQGREYWEQKLKDLKSVL